MRNLNLIVIARKEDNPELPGDLVVKQGIMCGPDVGSLSLDDRVRIELTGAGRAILHRLRREKYLPCPHDTDGDGNCGRLACPYCS